MDRRRWINGETGQLGESELNQETGQRVFDPIHVTDSPTDQPTNQQTIQSSISQSSQSQSQSQSLLQAIWTFYGIFYKLPFPEAQQRERERGGFLFILCRVVFYIYLSAPLSKQQQRQQRDRPWILANLHHVHLGQGISCGRQLIVIQSFNHSFISFFIGLTLLHSFLFSSNCFRSFRIYIFCFSVSCPVFCHQSIISWKPFHLQICVIIG